MSAFLREIPHCLGHPIAELVFMLSDVATSDILLLKIDNTIAKRVCYAPETKFKGYQLIYCPSMH